MERKKPYSRLHFAAWDLNPGNKNGEEEIIPFFSRRRKERKDHLTVLRPAAAGAPDAKTT
jgi:hypothetical protein